MCKNSWCERDHVYVVTNNGAPLAVEREPEGAREVARRVANGVRRVLVQKFCVFA